MFYNKELLSKRIQEERKKLGLSQTELGKLIPTSGKQISNYEKGILIPPIDNLLKLCSVFNCELGYLLGEPEYSFGTKSRTTVINETGLNDSSIETIRTITGLDKKDIECYNERETYKETLNKLLSSKYFIDLIHRLHSLEIAYHMYDNILIDVEKDIGEARIREALDLINVDSNYPPKPICDLINEDQQEAVIKVNNALDEQRNLEYDIKVARYELSRSFDALIEKLYPSRD